MRLTIKNYERFTDMKINTNTFLSAFIAVTIGWWVSRWISETAHKVDLESHVPKAHIQNTIEARELFYEGIIQDVDSMKYRPLYLNAKVQLREIKELKKELLR